MAPSAGVVHGSCESVGVNLPAGRHRARRPVVIFSTDDTVQVWDLATGQPTDRSEPHSPATPPWFLNAFGRLALAAGLA